LYGGYWLEELGAGEYSCDILPLPPNPDKSPWPYMMKLKKKNVFILEIKMQK
jgi:hypothetical protein